MKKVLFLAGLGVLSLVVWVFREDKAKQTPKITAHSTLESVITVHGSPQEGLKVCGKEFRGIKGAPPYYIAVPNTSLLLFVQESSLEIKTLIVCNTNECTFQEVSLEGIRFGDRVGYWNSTGGKMGDTVELVESNRVFLLSKSFSYVEKSVLDLNNFTIKVLDLRSEYNTIDLKTPTNN